MAFPGFPALNDGETSSGTVANRVRALKYMDRMLREMDDDELGDDFAALIREKKEDIVCRITLYEQFGYWLVYNAMQLQDPNERIKAAHAQDLLSAVTNLRADLPQTPGLEQGLGSCP